jgi:hypothetical protein
MYLIMNVACGEPDEPAQDDSRLPQFMTVDYVRVYQKPDRYAPSSQRSYLVIKLSPAGLVVKSRTGLIDLGLRLIELCLA